MLTRANDFFNSIAMGFSYCMQQFLCLLNIFMGGCMKEMKAEMGKIGARRKLNGMD